MQIIQFEKGIQVNTITTNTKTKTKTKNTIKQHPVMENTFEIRPYQADFKKHLKVNALFNIFEEMAIQHSSSLGHGQEHALKQGISWLVRKVRVKMTKIPHLGQKITVNTAPQGNNYLSTVRDFQIRDMKQQILGEASSSWILVNIEKKMPQKIKDHIKDIPQNKILQSSLSFERLKFPAVSKATRHHVISYSDLDSNNHVNNSRYIEWVTDSFPVDFLSKHRISDLQIEYHCEGKKDQAIDITSYHVGYHHYLVSITDKKNGQKLCSASVKFEE